PVAVHVAVVAVALDRDLPAAHGFLDQARLTPDLGYLGGQAGVAQRGVERRTDAIDAGADLADRLLQALLVLHAEGQLRGERLHRLDPHREVDVRWRSGTGREIDGAEAGQIGNRLALLQPAPVLVLALEQRLQPGRAQAPAFGQDR